MLATFHTFSDVYTFVCHVCKWLTAIVLNQNTHRIHLDVYTVDLVQFIIQTNKYKTDVRI